MFQKRDLKKGFAGEKGIACCAVGLLLVEMGEKGNGGPSMLSSQGGMIRRRRSGGQRRLSLLKASVGKNQKKGKSTQGEAWLGLNDSV